MFINKPDLSLVKPRPGIYFHPIEEIPVAGDPITDRTEKGLALETSKRRVANYNIFRDVLKPKCDVIYVPCFGNEIAHVEAFADARRIIHAEIDEGSVKAIKDLNDKHIEAHHISAKEYNPGEEVDILILLNQDIAVKIPASFVANGGYVLCNDYHTAATQMRKLSDFKLVGMIRPDNATQSYIFDPDAEDYWREVDTEDEFRNAPSSFTAINYDYAADIVEAVTGKRENILHEYKKIWAGISERDKKLMDGLVPITTNDGSQFFLTPLPSKKGTSDDIFVFQRVK